MTNKKKPKTTKPKAPKATKGSKSKSTTPRGPSKAEQRRWRAEDIVRDSITGSKSFKREVKRIERELAALEEGVEVESK